MLHVYGAISQPSKTTRVLTFPLHLASVVQSYREEQREYYVSTAAWSDVHPSQLVGPPACLREYDLLKVTVAELEAPLKVCFAFEHPSNSRVWSVINRLGSAHTWQAAALLSAPCCAVLDDARCESGSAEKDASCRACSERMPIPASIACMIEKALAS